MSNALDAFRDFMVSPADLDEPDYLMLYGNPGSGKSTLAASISKVAKFSPTLVISTEGGLKGILHDYNEDQIQVLEVTTHEGFEAVWNAVLEDDAAGTLRFKSVILDTFDVAFERALEYFDAEEQAKSKPDNFKKWAQVGEWANGVSRGMKDSNFLGITVLHSKRTKSENGPWEDMLNLSGAAKDKAAGVPDLVGFTVRENRSTTLHIGSNNNRATKSRFEHILPDTLVDADMPEIFDLLAGKKIAEPAPKKKTTTKKKEDK